MKKELKKETSRKELEEAQLRMYQSNVEVLDLGDTKKFKNLKHSMLSYKSGSLFCRSCSKSFTSKSELISHIRMCFSIDNERKNRYTKTTEEIVVLDEEIGQLENTAGSAADTGIKKTFEVDKVISSDSEKFRSNYLFKNLQKPNPDSKKPKTDQLIEISDKENETSDELGGISDEEIEISDEDRETSDEESKTSDEESETSDEENRTSDEEMETSDEERETSDEEIEISDEEGKISDEKRGNSDEQIAGLHADSAADTGNFGFKQTCEMDKVSLLKRTANSVVLVLPLAVEVKRYLKNNPSVKCDINVTNTECPPILKKLSPDSREHKTDQALKESEISDEERKISDEKRKNSDEQTAGSHADSAAETGNIGSAQTFEMDKVLLLKRTKKYVMLGLPYGWKKQCMKRQGKNSEYWYFYLINSDNKKFRSNVEVAKYLENNPSVKCDLSVTNTNWHSRLQSILNKLQKPNLDSKEHKTDQIEEITDEEIRISDEDRENTDEERKISDEKREESDEQTSGLHSDSVANTGSIEIEQTCEVDKVSLLKRTANSVVLVFPLNVEVKRYLKNNPSVKCDISVTNTKCPFILKKLQKLNPDPKEHKTDQALGGSEISDEERKTPDEERKNPCKKREISDEENETLDEEKSKMEQLNSEVTSEPFEFDNSSEDEMC